MYSVLLRFCGIVTLAGTNLLVLKLSWLASAKNLCVFHAIYPSQPSNFQSVCQKAIWCMSENYVCMYVYIHICNLKFLWLTPYCTVPVITVSAECCFLAGQSLHCSLCMYMLLLLKENGLHPSNLRTLAYPRPLGVATWAPLILLFSSLHPTYSQSPCPQLFYSSL